MAAEPAKRPARKRTAKAKAAGKRTGSRSGQPRGKAPAVPIGLLGLVEVDGKTRTRHEVLIGYLRLGADVAVCAAKAQVTRQTVHEWVRDGGRVAAAVEAGAIAESALSTKDAALLAFGRAAVEAVADAEAQALGNVVRLAQGVTRKRTTTRRIDGKPVEVVEVLAEDGPSLAANVVILERRFAERWNRRQQIEIVAGADEVGKDAPSPLPALLDSLEAMEARRREAIAELEAGAVADG